MSDKKYTLPDGASFALWTDETQYKRILHVSQLHGTIDGDGSKEHPFLTISQAVPLAEPGTKVIIHKGIYRETVRPIHSGKSEAEMVMFCGAEGETAEITGAEIFCGEFRESEGWKRREGTVRDEVDFEQKNARVYMARFDRNGFIGTNPFQAVNGPLVPWYGDTVSGIFGTLSNTVRQTAVLRRGMLFCDGQRMEQVLNYFQLGEKDNRFFVEDDGLTFHVRFKDDSAPEYHTLEFTAREQCFCPEERHFAYMHLKNLTFSKGGNGFPAPQRGILSVNCGHHWLIEDCRVWDANGVGADIGHQCPNRYSLKERGFMIVRGCEFSRCGIVGLTGTTGNSNIHYYDSSQSSILVEGNRFIDNCWQDFEELWESAAFKMHRLKDSMVINNFISGTKYGSGIWCDANNTNLLVAGNVLLHTRNQFGSIFLEASNDTVSIRHNIVVDSRRNKEANGGNGIYSHTCEDIKTIRNITLDCENYGIVHHWNDYQRIDGGSGNTGYGFDTFENIISDCAHLLALATVHCEVDRNTYGSHREQAPLRIDMPQAWLDLKNWRKNFKFDLNGRNAVIAYSLEDSDRFLNLKIDGTLYKIDLTGDIPSQIDEIFK